MHKLVLVYELVLVYGEAYFIFSFIFFSHKYLWRDLSKQKYHEEHKISQLNLKSTKKVKSIHKLSLCCNTYNLCTKKVKSIHKLQQLNHLPPYICLTLNATFRSMQ